MTKLKLTQEQMREIQSRITSGIACEMKHANSVSEHGTVYCSYALLDAAVKVWLAHELTHSTDDLNDAVGDLLEFILEGIIPNLLDNKEFQKMTKGKWAASSIAAGTIDELVDKLKGLQESQNSTQH